MTGRHRKQSNTARTAAKVAATGAMLGGAGLALSAPGAANAAPDHQWDQVAACESGGNWSINTGNGYHGGLQFSPSTWAGYGGTQYAPTANQATKAQQIAIAEKVLAGQGKGAWPTCGVGLGAPTPRTAPVAEKPAAKTPTVKAPTATQPVAKKPTATKPVAKKPVPKVAQNVATAPAAKKVVTEAKQSPNAAYIQQIIAQAQNGGKQIDPAVLAMLQQAAAKGY